MNEKIPGLKHMSRFVEHKASKPLMAVARKHRGPNGQPAGTIATGPEENYEIVTKAWGATYKGNSANQQEVAVLQVTRLFHLA